jgi:hypothetical protein
MTDSHIFSVPSDLQSAPIFSAERKAWVLLQLGGKSVEELGPLELKNALEKARTPTFIPPPPPGLVNAQF